MDAPHSSIFNFDRIRRVRTLSATTGAWFLFLTIAMAWGVWLAQTAIEKVLPTPQTSAVGALGPDVEVLVSGASRVLRGIEPSLYSNRIVNLSSGGLGYGAIEPIILRALERAPNVKLVVLEMDSFLIHNDGFATHWDTGRLYELGLHPWDFQVPWHRRILRILTQPPIFLVSRLTPENLLKRDPRILLRARRGFEPFLGTRNLAEDPDYAGHGPERFIQMHKGWLPKGDSAGNIPALVRLCQTLNARGIGVLLLRLPHLEVWWKGVHPQWAQQTQAAVQAVQAEVKNGVWFHDLAVTPEFDLWLFTDGLHYNNAGIQRLAEILNPVIVESCHWSENKRDAPPAQTGR